MRTTIDAAGRVVVPKPMREKLRLTPGMSLEIEEEDGRVVMQPSPVTFRLVRRDGVTVAEPDRPLPPLSVHEVRELLEATRDRTR